MVKKTQELLDVLKGVAQPEDYIEKEEDNLVKMELYVNLRRMRRRRDVSLPYSFLFDRPSVQGV